MITSLVGIIASSITSVVYDPDAQAFFNAETAAGVTLTNSEKLSINNLVVNLKAAGLWTKMKAIYPFISSTSTSQKFNLKNPADTDAAFRLSFVGGWTHSSNGALPNGTNAYANPFINTATILTNNSSHISFYSRTDIAQASVDWGVDIPSTSRIILFTKWTDNNLYSDQYNASTNRISFFNSASTGFYISNRSSSTSFTVHKGGIALGSNTAASSSNITNQNILISALNTQASPISLYSSRQCAFASLGDGLTDLEAQVFNQIVEGYQYSLGRNINPAQSFYYNPSYNNETNAFLYSTQIVDLTTQGAVNTLVNDMKTYGVWSKMKAVYPMVGSTSTTQKFNLVNSQDLNSSYRLSFLGGWTHSSNGALPNGTNAYADTFFISNGVLSLYDAHMSFYSRNSLFNAPSAPCLIGVAGNSGTWTGLDYWALGTNSASQTGYQVQHSGNTATDFAITPLQTSKAGFWLGSRRTSNPTTLKISKNGSVISNATTNPAGQQTNIYSVYISAMHWLSNSPTFVGLFDNSECAFASIGNGLTDSEIANFRYSVEKFQTTLGRSVSTNYPTVSDTDAQSFINTANITDLTQANAVNDLVIGLKADGIWTKMKAIYPMVGGSASSHSINLKTQSQFNLSFVGGWTHSSTGATPNGTNAYANTFLTPSTSLSINNTHLSYYSRSNTSDAGQDIGCAILTTEAQYCSLIIKNTNAISANYYIINVVQSNVSSTSAANSDSRGFFLGSRTASNVLTGFKNSTKILNSSTNSTVIPNVSIYIGALNYNNSATQFVTKECSFSSIGDGLTDTDATNLYSRVQTFQTTLGRAII